VWRHSWLGCRAAEGIPRRTCWRHSAIKSLESYIKHRQKFKAVLCNKIASELDGWKVVTRNKKLCRCWDSATCEPLDAEIIATKVQNFFHTHCSFSVELGITWYCESMSALARHTGSQLDTDLSCHVLISIFLYYLMATGPTSQTDGRHVCSKYRPKGDMHRPMACHAKNLSYSITGLLNKASWKTGCPYNLPT